VPASTLSYFLVLATCYTAFILYKLPARGGRNACVHLPALHLTRVELEHQVTGRRGRVSRCKLLRDPRRDARAGRRGGRAAGDDGSKARHRAVALSRAAGVVALGVWT